MPRAAKPRALHTPEPVRARPKAARTTARAAGTAISLYTGAGGLDLGFEAAGFETKVAVERDPEAVATLRKNRPSWEVIDADIHSEAAGSKALLSRGALRPGDASILIGGPPCQPFSKSGYWAHGDAKRLADPRADTLGAYLRVLRDTQPAVFLLENVPGLAYSEKDEGLDFLRRHIDRLNRELRQTYSFQVALLRAVDFGVPQDRQRVFVVGARDGTDFVFPGPTHLRPISQEGPRAQRAKSKTQGPGSELLPYRTAWDAIGDLEDDDDPRLAMTGKWAALLPSIPEGKNYLFHTERGEADGGMPLFGWRRRYWNFLLKVAKALPSPTIAAQPGPATGPFHWKNRRLSAEELMRLQTFPRDYHLVGDLRAAQRQVGNAVPSALAETLALEIRRQLLGDHAAPAHATLVPDLRRPIPAPERTRRVPKEFRALAGEHEAHPGTGKGYGALRRV